MYLSALIQFAVSTDCYIDLLDGIKLHSLKHLLALHSSLLCFLLCWHI